MAEFSARRVVAIAAVAGALVGGTVAAGVAVVSPSGSPASSAPPSGDSPITTAPVVRTSLTNTVQEGGSIGFEGSYTVATPSGTSAQQVAQAQQTVTLDRQSVSADEQAESDTSMADNQAVAAVQANVNTASATLSGADGAKQAQDSAGTGGSTATCSQDAQKVSSDQTALTQANQQLAAAQSTAPSQQHQNQAKVASDQTKLEGDEATLASLQASAVNPGTTYTALPKVGAVISQDQSLYSVSNEPVPLLYGSTAAYRAFSVGMSDGADVGELTQDLIALGYGTSLTQSDRYTFATASAVQRWQSSLGLPATGEVLLGQVIFEPGPIRITSVTPSVGASVGSEGSNGGGGVVLTATSTTPDVTVALDVSQEYLVKPGDAVSIVLPNGTTTVGGHIQTIGNVATCPGGGVTGTATGATNGSSTADQSTCSSGGGGTSTPTVTVTITLDSVPELATLDQAPVNVDITTERDNNVLAVPVNALLALQGGGFGVDEVSGSTSHLVGVTTGLYSNNLVQVSGSGVRVGVRVQVPSS